MSIYFLNHILRVILCYCVIKTVLMQLWQKYNIFHIVANWRSTIMGEKFFKCNVKLQNSYQLQSVVSSLCKTKTDQISHVSLRSKFLRKNKTAAAGSLLILQFYKKMLSHLKSNVFARSSGRESAECFSK